MFIYLNFVYLDIIKNRKQKNQTLLLKCNWIPGILLSAMSSPVDLDITLLCVFIQLSVGVIYTCFRTPVSTCLHLSACCDVADFGLSVTFSKDELMKTHCGSPEYAAPELFANREKYGPEIDVWSL